MTFANIGAVTGFYATVFCIVLYWRVAMWWKKEVGQNLMALAGCLLIFFTLRMIVLVFGQFPGLDYARGCAYFVIAGILVWRTDIILRAQLVAKARAQATLSASGQTSTGE